MGRKAERYCCVCGVNDGRALVDVVLAAGDHVILCGSHAVMHSRARAVARSEAELRVLLRDRRKRRERRADGDELAAALTSAFRAERREGERRRA